MNIISKHKQNSFYFILFFLFLFSGSKVVAQESIYINKNWKKTNKDSACFYRPKPLKFKTKDVLGFKVKNIDSIFQIKDYYF